MYVDVLTWLESHFRLEKEFETTFAMKISVVCRAVFELKNAADRDYTRQK